MGKAPGELDVHVRIHRMAQGRSQRARLRTPLRKLQARGMVARPLAPHSQPVIVKVDTPGPNAKGIQVGDLQHGKGRDQTEAALYGPGASAPQRFTRPCTATRIASRSM